MTGFESVIASQQYQSITITYLRGAASRSVERSLTYSMKFTDSFDGALITSFLFAG